jgi:hypothetical protein
LTKEVATACADYTKMSAAWALPRALMGGTRAMRAAGTEYLPQEPAESNAAYKNRLSRSTLFNGFKRTVGGVVGKVFSKDPVLEEDVPANIVEWSEDIDLAGRNLANFAKEVFKDGVQVGLSHILVDMPSGDPAATRAQELETNRRPYFVHIRAEDLISWQTQTINGKETLAQIRFRERATVADGDYGEKTEDRIRVLWRDKYEVWKKIEGKSSIGEEWVLDDSGPVTLNEIPLSTFYASRTGYMTAEPPLEDLAHLNVAHWQSASDQRHILHIARVPILFGKALNTVDEDGNPIEIGPNHMVTSSDEHGDLKYVEHGGAGISAGRQDLLDTEDRMRVMGLEVYMPKQQTLGEKAIDSDNVNSQAKAMAMGLKDAMEQALGYMAKWAGNKEGGGSVQVHTDFLSMSSQNAQELTLLLNARLAGEISRQTFWGQLKRRGLLMDDFDAEQEAGLLDDELPGAAGELDDAA